MASFLDGVVFLGIIGLGVVLTLGGIWWFIQQNWELMRYNETQAEIVTAEIKPHSPWFESVVEREPNELGQYGVEPHIEYSYQIEGEEYISTRLWPYGVTPVSERLRMQNQDFASKIVEPFESGDQGTAYYHPGNPEKSFLFRERDFLGPGLLVGFGAVVLVYLITNL